MSNKNIIVAGAGLVGSLVASYLAKRGNQVTIYERRPDMRQQSMSAGKSINLALSRRGWRALERVGIKESIEKIAIPMKGRMVHLEDGSLDFQPYGREGQAIFSVSRGELNKQLMSIAEDRHNVKIHFNHRCHDVLFDENKALFKNQTNGEITEVNYDYIFGADGAFSGVRNAIMHDTAFNYSQQYLEHGYQEYHIEPKSPGQFEMEAGALHIWPRKSFMLIALPNPDGSFTCTLFAPFKGENSFEEMGDLKSAEAYFKKHFPDALELMDVEFEKCYNNNPVSALVTVRCSPWVYKNAALIGDAAHAIVPFYGQGMNAGFEDCRVLDDIMEAHGNDWDAIFEKYNESRKPDGDAIADLAIKNFIEMRDLVSDPLFLNKKKVEKLIINEIKPDYLPLYSQVTFSDLRYSEALQRGEYQNSLLYKLIQEESSSDDLSDDQVRRVAEKYVSALN